MLNLLGKEHVGTTQIRVTQNWSTNPSTDSTYKIVLSPFQATALRVFVKGGTDKQLGVHGINDGCGDWMYVDVNGGQGTGIAIDPNTDAPQAYAYQSQLRGSAQTALKAYFASTALNGRLLLLEEEAGTANRAVHIKHLNNYGILLEAGTKPGLEFRHRNASKTGVIFFDTDSFVFTTATDNNSVVLIRAAGAAVPATNQQRAEGSLGSPTAISGAKILGIWTGEGYDGSAYGGGAAWWVESEAAFTSTSRPGRIIFATTPSAATSRQERMRLTADGTLGVGTTNPGVTNANGRIALFTAAAHDYLTITADYGYQSSISLGDNTNGQDIVLYRPANTRDFYIYTTTLGTAAVAVLQGGTVGIATTAPSTSYKLDVNGDVRCVSLTQTSDLRLKRDVRPIEDPLARVRRLRGVTYAWNERLRSITRTAVVEGRRAGIVAQDVEAALPEAARVHAMRGPCVHAGPAATEAPVPECDGSCSAADLDDAKSIDIAGVVALLVEAVKAIDARTGRGESENSMGSR